MSHPITNRLDELRRKLRRAGLLRGGAIVVLTAILGLMVAGFADAAVRANEPAWRILLVVLAFVPAMAAAAVVLVPPLRSRPTAVELARRAEQADPEWRGQLSAAVAYLSSEASSESQSLWLKVVDDAAGRLETRPLPDLVIPNRITRPLISAAIATAVGFAALLLFPASSITALSRIAFPFSAIEWPRDVDLVLLDESGRPLSSPLQIGRGQTLRFMVRNDRGDVPEDLSLEILPSGGRRRTEPVPMADDAAGEENSRLVGLGSLFATEGPLRFRAVGGDDREMPFLVAQVVPPPVLDRIEVTLTPPAYLGLPPASFPPGVGHINGVVGSSVTVKGRSNKPLGAAELVFGDRTGPAPVVDADGRTVTATFLLSEPGSSSYWFRLKDQGGFENSEAVRYELRVAADAVPEVSIREPFEDIRATAEADLPILVEATDDRGLAWVRMRYGRGTPRFDGDSAAGDDGTPSIPLFDGPDRPAKGTYPLIWSLGPLNLVPGDRLSFRAEAGDAFDLGPPHIGVSSPRVISIVSAVEKREELLDRQSELLDELSQARGDEERLGDEIDSLLGEIAGADEMGADVRDRIARTEAEQRRLAAKLSDPHSGVESRAVRIAIDLRANRIDDAPLAERLERIARELASLREDALSMADRDLTEARKADDAETASKALSATRNHLDIVVGGLDALLRGLGNWRDRRDLAGEVADILSVQRELAQESEKAAAETLGVAAGELTDMQAANLERLGLRQASLADRLARLGATIERQAAGEPIDGVSDGDRSADAGLHDASELIRTSGLPATARAAGDSIRGNDLGEAGRLQAEVTARLRELREILVRPETSAADSESLRKTAARIAELVASQKDIAEQLEKSSESGEQLSEARREELSRRQAVIREQTVDVGRRLRSAGVASGEGALRDASRRMADTLERLSRQDDEEAARDAHNAAERLDQARREAERATEELDSHLSQELLESSSATVAALLAKQRSANSEIARLERLKVEGGRLSRSQLRTLRQLAETQRSLARETAGLAERLNGSAVVALALRSAAERMELVTELLDDNETGDEPQGHGLAAQETFERLAAALQASENKAPEANDDPSKEANGPPRDMISLLTQLELLKALQEDLLRRTETIDEARSEGGLMAFQEGELRRISEEQSELTEVFLRLVGTDSETEAAD